jgi:hypothetical protein
MPPSSLNIASPIKPTGLIGLRNQGQFLTILSYEGKGVQIKFLGRLGFRSGLLSVMNGPSKRLFLGADLVCQSPRPRFPVRPLRSGV